MLGIVPGGGREGGLRCLDKTAEVNMGSKPGVGVGGREDRGIAQRDRKWKYHTECRSVFSRPRRMGTTSTPAEPERVNG